MTDYVCPNGHAVALVEMLPCNVKGCMAMVAYEPCALGMALDRQLQGAVEVAQQSARDVLSLAEAAGMPDSYRETDSRMIRAREVLESASPAHLFLEKYARARGLAQALANCPDDHTVEGVRDIGAEIAALLSDGTA